MNWGNFAEAAPEFAKLGRTTLDRHGLILLGTLRRDGYPRIAPVEPVFAQGELYLGMMWQSRKAQDLQRDPRCTVHSAACDRLAKDGEFKVTGPSREVLDLEEREIYCQALEEKIGWHPTEPRFHVFAIGIESASFSTVEEDKMLVRIWRATEPKRVEDRRISP